MAITFDQVKTLIPGVGYRAYIWCTYMQQGLLCEPNQLGSGIWECHYLFGEGSPQDSWQGGGYGPLNGIFPSIGDWVSVEIVQPLVPHSYILCYKLLEIVDEATFNVGTCTSCYNHGYGGQCSDVFITVPPLPGDPNGCRYNNIINPGGLPIGSLGVYGNPTYTYTAWISSNCEDCTGHVPPSFAPNMIVNCCDPSVRYQLDPLMYTSVWQAITGTGPGQLGVNNYQQAFRAYVVYVGGVPNPMPLCWHLEHVDPTSLFGPYAISITFDPVQKYPDCGHLNHHITNSFNPPYKPCCPPTPDECDSNVMLYLEDKITDFKIIKDSILNP